MKSSPGGEEREYCTALWGSPPQKRRESEVSGAGTLVAVCGVKGSIQS